MRGRVQQRAEDVLHVEGVREDAVRGQTGGGGGVGKHDVRTAGAWPAAADADEEHGGEECEERGEDKEAGRRGGVRPEECRRDRGEDRDEEEHLRQLLGWNHMYVLVWIDIMRGRCIGWEGGEDVCQEGVEREPVCWALQCEGVALGVKQRLLFSWCCPVWTGLVRRSKVAWWPGVYMHVEAVVDGGRQSEGEEVTRRLGQGQAELHMWQTPLRQQVALFASH